MMIIMIIIILIIVITCVFARLWIGVRAAMEPLPRVTFFV